MRRDEFMRPYQQSAIDYNGSEALIAVGEDVRPYPRYLPIPYNAIAKNTEEWTFDAYRGNLIIFPELYFVVGRDTEMDEENIGEDVILGYGVGLCVMDDGMAQTIKDGAARDYAVSHWYSQYADNCHLLLPEMFQLKSTDDVKLTVSSPTIGSKTFDQSKLNWPALKLMNAISPLNAARKYDLVILGAAEAPITISEDTHFAEGEQIEVNAGELGSWKVTVRDLRSKETTVPVWHPRPFACDPDYLDVN